MNADERPLSVRAGIRSALERDEMNGKSRFGWLMTGVVTAAAFLKVSFEADFPEHVEARIVAVVLGVGSLVLVLLLRRAGPGRKNSPKSGPD
jgi:hypothetical protein